MEQKETFAIGDRVDQMCVQCGEPRGHVIVMLSKLGKITRVSCPMCDSRVPYKRGSTRVAFAVAASPYDRGHTYRRGQTMTHPTFGEGEVTAIIEPGKIDVLFSDRIRRLIHSNI
jgi:DNA-directed RNA polymerase subunit RPC12/RpoP